jgi:deoxyribonuclease V
MSIACIDVGYTEAASGETTARAACVTIANWSDAVPSGRYVVDIKEVQPYQPGQFYRRELPCVQAVLEAVPQSPQIIVVDGYVWLGPNHERGLGAYLHEAIGDSIPVIGVAKNRFRETAHAVELYRGRSSRPLFVTAIGMSQDDASKQIEQMHGDHRVPTVLKLADTLSRG